MATRVDYKGVPRQYNYKEIFEDEDPEEMVEFRFSKLIYSSSAEEIFEHSEKYFSQDKSLTKVPDIRKLKMKKSFLKTQLVCGAAFYIISDNAKNIIYYTLIGAAGGIVAGAVVGAAVGGATTGGPGIVPGMLIGGVIGLAVGGGAGLGWGLGEGIDKAIEDVRSLYRDFKILKETEAGTHKSMSYTVQIAHNFFMSFLRKIDKKETELNIFCVISGDIMIIPVKTNCGHVYELLSITNSLKGSKSCPMCKKKVKEITFDFQTIKAVNDALKEAMSYLRKSAGGQNLLLLKKRVAKSSFSESDNITAEKIERGGTTSLAEKRTLYCIANYYLENQMKITAYVKDVLSLMLRDSFIAKKITSAQREEMEREILEWI